MKEYTRITTTEFGIIVNHVTIMLRHVKNRRILKDNSMMIDCFINEGIHKDYNNQFKKKKKKKVLFTQITITTMCENHLPTETNNKPNNLSDIRNQQRTTIIIIKSESLFWNMTNFIWETSTITI